MTAVNGKQRTLFQTIGLVVVMGGQGGYKFNAV